MLDLEALKREYSSTRHLLPKLTQEKMGVCGSSVPILNVEALKKEYASTPASAKEPSVAGIQVAA